MALQVGRSQGAALVGIFTLSLRHFPPVQFFFSPSVPPPPGNYCWASVLAFPPQGLGEGGPGRGLAARSSCAPGLFPVMPSSALGPGRGLLPCLGPAQGSLFSLLGAEAKRVFLPRSGIAPQKHTMQLLKYLGLAGQPHSGPLVRLRRRPPPGSQVGSMLLPAGGVRQRPRSSGVSAALGASPRRTADLCISQAGWHIYKKVPA